MQKREETGGTETEGRREGLDGHGTHRGAHGQGRTPAGGADTEEGSEKNESRNIHGDRWRPTAREGSEPCNTGSTCTDDTANNSGGENEGDEPHPKETRNGTGVKQHGKRENRCDANKIDLQTNLLCSSTTRREGVWREACREGVWGVHRLRRVQKPGAGNKGGVGRDGMQEESKPQAGSTTREGGVERRSCTHLEGAHSERRGRTSRSTTHL